MSILNIAAYRFVAIADPSAVVARVRAACEAGDLKGTVLVAPEGINLFLAGEGEAIHEFLRDLGEDPRFAGLTVKFSDSETVPFQRLRVKLKREIITFRDESLVPAAERAPALSPERLQQWLRTGRDDAGRELVLLDTRNRQEVAYGSFKQALTLPIDKFTELPEALEAHRDALADKTIVSFCTGGIRCEKAALWMQQAGYRHVLQLEGGILGYFEQVGGEGYDGDCFVFDERVALSPALKARRSA
ncbi:sulfurtransferase [Arenimonas oryziterrae]|uniref:tRNA uridine(34) hydroxylase n=1 Tax=Arenimonas oryziterrae DSM 21050 = YC6267 TaxID=1121015 RepID=A0A091B147_9GAMM|nr:sulfurtransferase [Arenimonas oryziterrae]KFN44594.1 hypothetical protein N789_00880 [Arenimonas oryziterrae DSM 21050 = YC6267]